MNYFTGDRLGIWAYARSGFVLERKGVVFL
jgi:hypothetical protein